MYNEYAAVQINGVSQEIYLVVEKPASYCVNQAESPILLRRNYRGTFETIYVEDDFEYLKKNIRDTRKAIKKA